MKEVYEFRINNQFINLLPPTIKGKNIGPVTIIKTQFNSPEYDIIRINIEKNRKLKRESFLYGWNIKRSYSKKEVASTSLFQLIINNIFEPTGEQCGTLYDETTACKICGANDKQISPLKLKKIPKKDIAKTIGGEIIVSRKFVDAITKRNLKGLIFNPINSNEYYQLLASEEIELSNMTLAGVNPFNFSESSEMIDSLSPDFSKKEIYKCPKGHTIGLNLLSEAYVLNQPILKEFDFLMSRQKVGVKRGFLRPEPLYFCSQLFRKMIEEEELIGFSFEIANIE